MATISFYLESDNNPAKIYVRFRDGRKVDLSCPTNILINPKDWNPKKKQPNNIRSMSLNKVSRSMEALKNAIIESYNLDSSAVDKQWLKDIISPKAINDIPAGLVAYIDYYIECRSNELTPTMKQRINVVKEKLSALDAYYKKEFLVEDINEAFLKSFVDFCNFKKYGPNTQHRDLVYIKQFCKHAHKKGLPKHPEFDDLSLKKEKVVNVHLTFSELNIINSVPDSELPGLLLDARDWLIISAYTGQRVSDFMRFDKSMIIKRADQLYVDFVQVKGNKPITLPLHPIVVEILHKRNGDFPVKMHDTDYNGFLKDVCGIAGITQMVYGSKNTEVGRNAKGVKIYRKVAGNYPKNELVTSHIGRRSFATNNYGRIPTPLLMAATGHTKEETFLLYIGKSPMDKAIELAKWF